MSAVIELESALSDEAVSIQNHVERITNLENQIKATEGKERVGRFFWEIGWTLGLGALVGLAEAIVIHGIFRLTFSPEASFVLLFPVALIVLGFFVSRYYVDRLKPLEEEFTKSKLSEDFERNLKNRKLAESG